MNIFADFHARIVDILQGLSPGRLPEGLDAGRFVVEPPREAALGDLAVNAAMVFAKLAKAAVRQSAPFATEIAFALVGDPDVAQAEVAGSWLHQHPPLKPHVFRGAARRCLQATGLRRCAAGRVGEARRINVGICLGQSDRPDACRHGRGAVFGDAGEPASNCRATTVTREYYINDAGAQVDVLARPRICAYREALGEDIGANPDGLYPATISNPGRQGAGGEIRRQPARQAGERMAGRRSASSPSTR